jgi:DTW domain-containing protein YfiP
MPRDISADATPVVLPSKTTTAGGWKCVTVPFACTFANITTVVLPPLLVCAVQWPGDDALEPQQLLELAQQRGTSIALIALDGTWDCARKMKSRYPPGLLMLKVPPHLALPDAARQRQQKWEEQQQHHHQQQVQPEQQQQQQQQQHVSAAEAAACPVDSRGREAQPAAAAAAAASSTSSSSRSRSSSANGRSLGTSGDTNNSSTLGISHKHHHQHYQGQPASLFRPLRKYQGNAAQNGRVCTLEAVAGALLALEGDEAMYDGLLHALKLKVDAMRRQKHMGEVYGTTTAADE